MESNSKWEGWYAAPAPFGKTTFELTILQVTDEGELTGEGVDKEGEFVIKGKISGSEIEFIKDYKDPKHYQNIKYKGTLSDRKVSGKYEFLYKTFLIKLNVCEDFEMVKIDSN